MFSERSSIHLTGCPVFKAATTARTYPGYTGTLPPNPPPISGEMMRIFCSGRPATRANTVRIAWGAWVVIQTVSLPIASNDATQPHVSMDDTWIRGMYRSSWTTTSDSFRAFAVPSRSPTSQCQIRFVCSFRSGRRMGASGSNAFFGSTTTGRGSYSTSTAATPSAAAYRLSATTAATSCDWYMTRSTGRTICLSDIRVGIQARFAASRSFPRITARTPGTFNAFSMFMYPVQRHRFPEIPRRICSSVGCGFFWRNATEHIIIPGVQKPHWRPCSSMKPSWIAWSLPSVSRPSTVRTSRPSAWTARIVQDFTALPSRRIVHAPQFVVSQPMCVPVKLRFSRRKCTSRVRVSTVADRRAPFTVTWTFTNGPVSSSPAVGISARTISCTPAGPSRGAMQRPERQDADHRPLVLGGTPQIRNGARDLLRQFRGSLEGGIVRRLPDEMPLRFRRLERGRSDRRERKACGFNGSLRGEHEIRGDPDDGEVADSLLELHIRIALALLGPRDLDFQEDFIRLERRDERVLVEFVRRDRPRSVRAADDKVGPEGEHAGREVVRRIPMRHVPADRPHVPHEGIRDLVRGVGEHRIARMNDFGIVQVVRPRRCPDPQGLRVLSDVGEVRNAIDVDQGFRLGKAEFHHRK